MSENEQKAGRVDDAVRQAWRAAITLANNICVQESDRHNDNDEIEGANTGSECAKRIREYVDLPDAHLIELLTEAGATAALEAAALSPARSGEAVGYVYSEVQDDGTRIKRAALQGKHAQTLANGTPLYAAPRNESSGVSPGGDRRVLVDALENLDNSAWECPRCGHTDDCATMDVAHMIRQHLATPAPQDSVRVGDGMRELAANTGTLAVAAFLTGELATPAPAAGADGLRDTRKVCTCEGRQSCGVLAGNQLGDLWRCALGHENRPLSDGAGQSSGGG